MASRTLHPHERRYSQLDKEAASIMFGIKKFHNYLTGRQFCIITDHKPLLGIFDPKKPMPNMISPRLTRIAIALTSHNYEIKYKPGPEIGNADHLSRWPQPVQSEPQTHIGEVLLMAEAPEDFPFDAEDIARETNRDKILSKVIYYIQRGWPAKETDADLRPFWLHRTELSLQENCILLGCRVVVPHTLRRATLQILHKTHTGIVQTKALARSYVWWPGLNDDIELLVGGCVRCLENRHMPPKTTHEWITPSRPWSRIHIDFAGPYHNKYFLIIVDAYSRWPEVFMVNNTTTATVIRLLRTTFATHGLCEVLVSDNGTSFVSGDMKHFLQANKIRQVTTAPYHPATNGLAERMVQTVKDKLKKMNDLSWDIKIPNLWLGLRVTPCTGTNKTPAELLMNRQLRTLLDTIHPDNLKHKRTEIQIDNNKQIAGRETTVGQNVMFRNYSNQGPKWLPGKVLQKSGPSNYKIETEDGVAVNRHIDQLIKYKPRLEKGEEGITDITSEANKDSISTDSSGTNYQHGQQENSSQESERIIEIPDAEKWAEILGIPPSSESTLPVPGKIRTKLNVHSRTPYQRPQDHIDNLYLS
ncbi:uncharacterized protein K02A2.6-like [Achroia grisella]|uniref:uncharacterized protein K02A2.6-like n=1 Tax=Achroia grisella TaxID=688607 RepID=UPI0027D2540E|nr:uncharacterized protein K02A2.6-like [Achroia grisella]